VPIGQRGATGILAAVEWVFVAILAGICTVLSLWCLVVLIARNRLHRHHRVDPALPTDAPLIWLVDPRTPAKLHRRLARVGTTATAVADDHRPTGRRRRRMRRVEPSAVHAAAQDVRTQAVLLDRQLALLATLAPAVRRRPLVELSRSVADIEVASARLVALSTQVRAPRGLATDDPALHDISQRVDRLAHAHQELLALDDDAGLTAHPLPAPPLVAPSPPARRRPPPPQTSPPQTSPPQTFPPSGRR